MAGVCRKLFTSAALRWVAALAFMAFAVVPANAGAAGNSGIPVANYTGLNAAQKAALYSIAQRTWNFYKLDAQTPTHLPMDNVTVMPNGTVTARGEYTSAANIGVYLWALVAASDMGLVSRAQAMAMLRTTMTEVTHLQRYNGFLYQWYDTNNGRVLLNPGQGDCTKFGGTNDNCSFISQVDNGWYVSGLFVVWDAMPELRYLVLQLMHGVNFGIFYDNGPENQCNVNPANGDPTGQMYGGYYVGVGPAGYHNGALYSDPRISAYIGMGLRQFPGNVWWRTWRILPPKACPTDPDFSWTGQGPGTGYWQNITDPVSHKVFHVWEGHYTYPPDPNLTFVPTWAGGMFEGEMANQVVPETSWGTRSFGLNDVRWAQVQERYATQVLGYNVWGMSPSSTPDDTGNYDTYGVTGLAWPYSAKKGLSQCYDCNGTSYMEDVVTPHASFIALDAIPQDAFNNIMRLRTLYPQVYGPDGFYDAVAMKSFVYNANCNAQGCQQFPVTAGQVGHRYLVLDQSMIMAALDNALRNRAMQRHFAGTPWAWAAHTYLSYETMSIH